MRDWEGTRSASSLWGDTGSDHPAPSVTPPPTSQALPRLEQASETPYDCEDSGGRGGFFPHSLSPYEVVPPRIAMW
ncbi:hypothetical protein E2562_004317 [Oryza meyeriana var. granulata]|uniref:Uncharacterized protein n=1 Tax=Oryza meyeriana var. granulata TaxID=110450 RepID=A0A6G1BSW0_9ORYZ|nr:hypothetical protein E2562_004317 [Oryza meyeriana var. granulata]